MSNMFSRRRHGVVGFLLRNRKFTCCFFTFSLLILFNQYFYLPSVKINVIPIHANADDVIEVKVGYLKELQRVAKKNIEIERVEKDENCQNENLKREINRLTARLKRIESKKNKQRKHTSETQKTKEKVSDEEIDSDDKLTERSNGRQDLNKKSKNHNLNEQQCNIPYIDPYGKEVRPYITDKWKTEVCWLRQRGIVKNGFLHLNISNIQRAGFYYIWRGENDDHFYFSKYHSIVDNGFILLRNSVQKFCLKIESEQIFLTMVHGDNFLHVSRDNKSCKEENFFMITKQKIIHSSSSRCVTTMKREKKTFIVLSDDVTSCLDDINRFKVTANGKIKHLQSRQCFVISDVIILSDCENAPKFTPYGGEMSRKDLVTKIKLEHDYIRFVYKIEGKLTTEHLMYPLKEQSEKRKSDVNKLNVLMLMVDSMSRASVQRYMKRTYHMLEQDPNSFIMKGQTINGEGTTAQVLAILTGTIEENLPSALRGQPNTCDSWPFIFKDYERAGYVTMFSEDYPTMNTFNYRLKGFKKQPTTKYLRPWWMASSNMFWRIWSPQCRHMFALQYLKDFMYEYKHEKTFSLTIMNLAHNKPSIAVLIDQDMTNFYQFLHDNNINNNTVIVLFGDHGDRSTGMRSTRQGHLEERLPFLSFTFPNWFREKYPEMMRNLKKNTEVLTTHFDHHSTLKHFLDFPNSKYKHKTGKSFFTDISVLNRTCEEAGIHKHWCPCLQYTNLDVSDATVRSIAWFFVEHLNELLRKNEKSKMLCAELTVKEISRCRKIKTPMNTKKATSYEITLIVSPSNGRFESTIAVENEKKNVEHFSRINTYGNQPACIVKPHPELRDFRTFCYCKSHISDLV